MNVDIRCDRCGKLLKVDAQPGGRTRCPACGGRVVVPPVLASLPRPHVPADAAQPATRVPVRAEPEEPAGVTVAVAGAMPWVLSLFLHLGVFLVMAFIVMLTATEPPEASVQIIQVPTTRPPDAGTMGHFRLPREGVGSRERDESRRPKPVRESGIGREKTDVKVDLIFGGQARGGAAREMGLTDSGARGGDGGMFPIGGGVHNVVYVVDRSGSMARTFDTVRQEMRDSISRLTDRQYFDIVLFADDRVVEGPGQRLIPATAENRQAAGRFLNAQAPASRTTALVALRRAFEVLRYARKDRPGKLVYLLSDGDFSGLTGGSRYRDLAGNQWSGNEAVLRYLRDHNRTGEVLVNTILLQSKDPSAIAVMKAIAKENGGLFRHIGLHELE